MELLSLQYFTINSFALKILRRPSPLASLQVQVNQYFSFTRLKIVSPPSISNINVFKILSAKYCSQRTNSQFGANSMIPVDRGGRGMPPHTVHPVSGKLRAKLVSRRLDRVLLQLAFIRLENDLHETASRGYRLFSANCHGPIAECGVVFPIGRHPHSYSAMESYFYPCNPALLRCIERIYVQ